MGNLERITVSAPIEARQPNRRERVKDRAGYWLNYFTQDAKKLWGEHDYRRLHRTHAVAMGAELASVYEMLHSQMPERLAFLGTALIAGAKVIPSALRIGEYHKALDKRRDLEKKDTYGPRKIESLIERFDSFRKQLIDAPDEYKDAVLSQRFGLILESELVQLGFQPIKAKLDRKATQVFEKEDDPSLPTDNFAVVKEKGESWLIKKLSRAPLNTTFQDVVEIVAAEEEEMAYKVGAAVDYPVPETRRVIFKGRPYLAYKYLDNAIDHGFYERQEVVHGEVQLSNPDDVALRPWFNALIGAFGDGAHQGIVDLNTGNYYANDIRLAVDRYPLSNISDKEDMEMVRAGLSDEAGNRGYGVPEPLAETPRVIAFINKVRDLTDENASQDKFPPRLRQRARTVSSLMEEKLVA